MSRRFLTPRLPAPGQRVTLDEATSHHLLRVCLVPRGQTVVLFDGAGAECDGLLVDTDGGLAVVEALGPPRSAAATSPLLLLMGLPRKPAWERVLRMGTELGVTTFLPFPAARSVATGLHPERWERIATAAAGQCGRGDRPVLSACRSLSEALAQPALRAVPRRLVLTPGAPGAAPGGGGALLVGPEGGLTAEELALAARSGFVPAGLGPWILRADTAAVAGLALLAQSPSALSIR